MQPTPTEPPGSSAPFQVGPEWPTWSSPSPSSPSAGEMPKQGRHTRLVLVLIGLALLLAAGGIVAVGVALDGGIAGLGKTALEHAEEQCAYGSPGITIGDDGHTMTIDRAGAKVDANTRIDIVTCILASLDTPDAVIAQIGNTRALDGRQQADWGDGKFHASWTYHPDDGLNMIIEER